MVDTGKRMGVPTVALLTDMNQPLGRMAGNANEVNESVDCLMGKGPADLMDVTLELGAELLVLTKSRVVDDGRGQQAARRPDRLGSGLEKFREMVAAQGGNLDAPRPVAPAHEIASPRAGYVTAIDTEDIGIVIIELGGGRKKLGDKLDLSVGIEMLVRLGDTVEAGQPLARIFARPDQVEWVTPDFLAAITIGDAAIEPPRTHCGANHMNDRDRQELIAGGASTRRSGSMRRIRTFRSAPRFARRAEKSSRAATSKTRPIGLTICAERVAATSAVAAGEKEFVGVAVASRGGVSPCGACRQFLAEFSPNVEIVMVDSLKPGEIHEATLAQLLPGRFEGGEIIDRAK